MSYSAGHDQHRRGPADRRAEQARRSQPRVAASLGAPLRAASSRPLSRRPSPLLPRRRRSGGAEAAAGALSVRDAVDEEAARSALRPGAIRGELAAALDAFDEPRAQAILDR